MHPERHSPVVTHAIVGHDHLCLAKKETIWHGITELT